MTRPSLPALTAAATAVSLALSAVPSGASATPSEPSTRTARSEDGDHGAAIHPRGLPAGHPDWADDVPLISHAATTPELPPGTAPDARQARALATKAASDCGSLRICAWTGGYFTGPHLTMTAGVSYNWGSAAEAACTTSGTSGANWKNCASSLRNRNTSHKAYFFAGSNGTGPNFRMLPGTSRQQLGDFDNDIESSTSSTL